MNCKKIKVDKDYNIIVQETYDPDYAYVYILQYNGENQIIIKDSEYQEVKFKTKKDGFYTLITLKVPTYISNYYYYKDQKFYRNVDEVTIEEILDTNPHLSNIYPIYDYYFLTARLKRCYIDACQKIFDSSGKCSRNEDKELIYNRDLIWSTLNVIEYMVEFCQYQEAQRLLEQLTGCNGICQEQTNSKCGCRHE